MPSEYVIKKRPRESRARIFENDNEIAVIEKNDGSSFKLTRHIDKMDWILSNVVDGERRPFSYAVQEINFDKSNKANVGRVVLVVRAQLFEHKGKIYMLANHPEGEPWKNYVNSKTRYISRLDNFPYRNLSEIDHDQYKFRHKIKRFRGTPVGQATGLAQEGGHRVSLVDELSDVGLFIAVVSYLLYASG